METPSDEATTYSMLRSKFRGAMLGALIGDCVGRKFEFAAQGSPLNLPNVLRYFKSFREPTQDTPPRKTGSLNYTDDTAMMNVLADSLSRNKNVDVNDLAEKFTSEYFGDRKPRGYGTHVVHVFQKLRGKPNDVLHPAQSQFNGTGSYGNGAAMRVTPVALFYHEDTQKMVDSGKASSLVTHAHADGYNGAILLCLAIQEALKASAETPIDPIPFIQHLEEEMSSIEKPRPAYGQQLNKMKHFFSQAKPPSIQQVVDELGNDVTALKSVPTAIYSFLRGQKDIEEIQAPNQYERTIQYAISLGGDTDTIGCMAGACCGAQVGEENLPKYLLEPCEAHDKVKGLADRLLDAMARNKSVKVES